MGRGVVKESHNNNFMIIITKKIKILIIYIAVVIFTMKIASIMWKKHNLRRFLELSGEYMKKPLRTSVSG